MKKKIKLKGHLKNYMYWPLMLTILLACMNVPMYFVNEGAALLVSIFLGIYLIVVVISRSEEHTSELQSRCTISYALPICTFGL